jgi:hypothetical protein
VSSVIYHFIRNPYTPPANPCGGPFALLEVGIPMESIRILQVLAIIALELSKMLFQIVNFHLDED